MAIKLSIEGISNTQIKNIGSSLTKIIIIILVDLKQSSAY